MNFVADTLPWWGWLTLLAVPPLIFLLYFLKLRRTPLKVPSTYLWTKTIEDMHVNSLWQKLRRNLLLWLQLLFALLLLLTCLRPGCDGTELTAERYIFLIDNSSSMAAIDTPTGASRLEFAKEEIRKSIQQMNHDTSIMLISFSNESKVIQSYTKNKSEALLRLAGIPQTQRGSDLNEALVAAAGLANPGRTSDRDSSLDVQVADALDAVLMIYSDGGVRQVPRFAQGNLSPEYRAVGSVDDPPNNVGIVAFSIGDPTMNAADSKIGTQVFARLQNSDNEDRTVSVSLFIDDRLQDAVADIDLKAGLAKGISFKLPPSVVAIDTPVEVRLEIDQDDVYLQDNVAWQVLNPPEKSNVLVISRGNPYFKFALSTDLMRRQANVVFEDWDYLKEKQYAENAVLGMYDLVIFEGVVPETMPQCNTVFMGDIPSDDWKIASKKSPTPVFDFDSTSPLMTAVQMGSVTILNSLIVEGPKGSVALIESADGPIAVLAPRDSFQDLVIGFSTVEINAAGETVFNTDWPRKLSFPIFFQNVVATLGGGANYSTGQKLQPGDLMTLGRPGGVKRVLVESPGGGTAIIDSQNENSFVFSDTDEAGIYRVTFLNADAEDSGDASKNQAAQLLPINLLDAQESNLSVRDTLNLGYSDLTSVRTRVPKRQEWWPWILGLGLVLLTIEWIVYNRRVFI